MKAIKGFQQCNRKKFFVVRALSFFLLTSCLITAETSGHGFYRGSSFPIITSAADKPAGTEWVLDKTVGKVDFYYKISSCRGLSVVLLKFNNRNKYNVKISWRDIFVTRQVEPKTTGILSERQLILKPGEMSASNCDETKNKECMIFSSEAIPAYRADILQYGFKDITVTVS